MLRGNLGELQGQSITNKMLAEEKPTHADKMLKNRKQLFRGIFRLIIGLNWLVDTLESLLI